MINETAKVPVTAEPPPNPSESLLLIDGRTPVRILTPANESEAVEAVRKAGGFGQSLVPVGGGTALETGNPLRAAEWTALSSDRLAGIIEYSPDDMVITAGSGTTLAALQAALAEHNQFLPLDPPFAGRSTLGGVVATNAHGLWRPAYGMPRDRLLGMRVVLADGSVVKAGGKVVKNVAGYDLCKLFAGSWGTLGFVTEVTFKSNPRPPATRHMEFAAPDLSAAIRAGLTVHKAMFQPVYSTVSVTKDVRLCVGMHGSVEAVEWQAHQIAEIVRGHGCETTDNALLEDGLRELVAASSAACRLRLLTRPSDLEVSAPKISEAIAHPESALAIHIPTGVVEAAFAQALFDRIRQTAGELPAAHLIWERLPEEMRQRAGDVWGPTRPDFAVMQAIKRSLDPNNLFIPGRFAGRL